MNRRVVIMAALTCGLLFTATASGITQEENNGWPGVVRLWNDTAGRPDETTALGPLFSEKKDEDARYITLRPFWLKVEQPPLDATSQHILYPLFNYYDYDGYSHWHVLNLLRGVQSDDDSLSKMQLFPFFFFEEKPGEDNDTLALWPVGGHLNSFFGRTYDFWAWPLFVRSERDDEIRYSTPWPFVETRAGEASGFGLWPLYGHFKRPGVYDITWAVWPLYYDYRDQFDAPEPRRRFGILPFYARETAHGLRSETYGWPFFGYTRESAPRPAYQETRYFWPFLVQGRGEERYVNRWMPFYTHERNGAATKTWKLWPLLKEETIELGFLTRQRTQFLFFLFRDETQTDGRGFRAQRQYCWPLYSYWDNGQGRRQLQAFDPFTVFMPRNRRFQENWTALFAIYRMDERGASIRRSWFWNLVVAEKSPDGRRFTLGPLYRQEIRGDDSSWEVLHGLVARSSTAGNTRWRFLWRETEKESRKQ